jgi:hypothetical protein
MRSLTLFFYATRRVPNARQPQLDASDITAPAARRDRSIQLHGIAASESTPEGGSRLILGKSVVLPLARPLLP